MINYDAIYSKLIKIISGHYTSNNMGVWIGDKDDCCVLPISNGFEVVLKYSKFTNQNGLEKFTKSYYNIIAVLKYYDTINEIILPPNPIIAINMLDDYIKGICKGMHIKLTGAWKYYFENRQ